MKITKKYWVIPLLSTIAAILAVLLAGCTGSGNNTASTDSVATESTPPTTDADNAAADAADAADAVINFSPDMTLSMNPEKPIVIDFNATWCGPCQKFGPIFHEVAAKYASKATFYSVDVDKNPELADKFKVSGIPMMVVIRPGGKIDTSVGFMSQPEFEKFINL